MEEVCKNLDSDPIDLTYENEPTSRLNPFAKFLRYVVRYIIRFAYGTVSGAIPEKDREKYDKMIDSVTDFSRNYVIDEDGNIIGENDMKAAKLVKAIVLVLDMIISIAAVGFIGYAAWWYFTKMG